MPKPSDNLKTLRRYSTCIFEDLVTPERQRAIDRCIEQNERVMHFLQLTAESNPHPNRPMVVDFNLALAALKESWALLDDAARADVQGQRWKTARLLVAAAEFSDRARSYQKLIQTEDPQRSGESIQSSRSSS